MTRSLQRSTILIGLLTGAVLAVGAIAIAQRVDARPETAVLVVLAASAALLLHQPLSLLGYLGAALLLRLPVVTVKLSPLRRSFVRVGPAADAPRLRLRMPLFNLAGPAMSLIIAYGTWLLARHRTGPVQAALDAAALGGLLFAGQNLIPVRYGAHRSSGRNALRWLLRPDLARSDVALVRESVEDRALLDDVTSGRLEPAALYALVADPSRSPKVLLTASAQLISQAVRAGHDETTRALGSIADLARSPDVDRRTGGLLATTVANAAGLIYLKGLRDPAAAATAEDIAEVAELARLGLDSGHRQVLAAHNALAVAQLLQGRPAEVAVLLTPEVVRLPAPAQHQGTAMALRTIAQSYLGATPGAERVLATARSYGCPPSLCDLAEQLVADSRGPGPEQPESGR
ncbi:hypothetical protein Cs7R123_16460 [Catellatospora sp. TT07R-123]|uniref:hypothetical protein n=1 Tax=Catellatospora sp. TT07R-123 TaxID=2733863 RepID=UPI001B0A3787|nr:hypothetical protein [Catellatospora sp. TT07R-123]GHJ44304.1 hypothetical protein Cs7R123_16460 [Catellatospora sp. TT07R-123]